MATIMQQMKSLNFFDLAAFLSELLLFVFLSILKRRRENFPLFVPMRNCDPARAYLGVHDRISVTDVHHS